jgi:hypothetical protein
VINPEKQLKLGEKRRKTRPRDPRTDRQDTSPELGAVSGLSRHRAPGLTASGADGVGRGR